jgi:hypothetical protein
MGPRHGQTQHCCDKLRQSQKQNPAICQTVLFGISIPFTMAVMKQVEARAKRQLMRLMCLECDYRFTKAVTHCRQIDLCEQRQTEVAAIRCPACASDKFDSDLNPV